MPRLVMAPGISSSAARRAITLRSSSGMDSSVLTGTFTSPKKAALNGVLMLSMWFCGCATTT